MALPLIPIIGGALATFSLAAIKSLLPFILISAVRILGLTVISYTAIGYGTDAITGYLLNSFNNIGVDVLGILKMGGFLDAINIVIAGWVASLQIRATLGAFSRLKLSTGAPAP